MLHELTAGESVDMTMSSDESSEEQQNGNKTHRRSSLAKDLTSKIIDKTMANVTLLPQSSSESPTLYESFNCDCIQLARAHWMLMSKNNGQQMLLCKQIFIDMIQKNPQTRPIWQFSRDLNFDNVDWQEIVQKDNRFRHHCASLQAAITMIMDNLDDMHGMAKLLREIGAHHFFYDAYEPHMELMHDSFMNALNLTQGPLEPDLVTGWNQFWLQIKTSIAYGIGIQRQNYLKECMTQPEMTSIRNMWDKVKERDLDEVGQKIVKYSLRSYQAYINKHKIEYPINLPEDTLAFKLFSRQVFNALNLTIECYTPEKGFLYLPKKLKGFVTQCLMVEVCPTLIRKSFMEGLIKVLTEIYGENNMTEVTVHTWSKIYRILEQVS
uniref:Globin family profile domain-containing protein n=1 Tax=Panagrolaimus sp. JU765 TaxID=591449 RepID=A0AC34R126_9BILA